MGFFFLIVFGLIIYFSVISGKETSSQWKKAAEQLHLRYEPGVIGAGSIHGQLNGNRVAVTVFNRGSGQSSRPYTRYRMDYRNPIPVEMKVVRQGMLQELGKAFGMQDIEVGNPAFDNYFIVKGSDIQGVRKILSPPVQSVIISLLSSFKEITVTGNYVEIIKSGRERESVIITHTLRRLASFCETIMEADEKSAPLSHSIAPGNKPPELPYITVVPPGLPCEPPELPCEPPEIPSVSLNPFSIPTPVVVTEEPPDFVEEEETTAKKQSIPIQLSDKDYDAESVEEEPEATKEKDHEPPQKEDTASPTTEDLLEVARTLFADAESSLLVSKLFNERFKDHPVEGKGTMIHLGKFSYDPTFSGRRGVKATYKICSLDGPYSKIRVIAEVMYPENQHDRLEKLQEQEVCINGTLISHDPIMHRLHIVALQT